MRVKFNVSTVLFYVLTVCIFCSAAYLCSAARSTFAQVFPSDQEHTFVIDAGHGGVDGGATSCTGKLESAFNLEIALRMNDLMHFLGCGTRMIRTEDVSIYTKGDTIAQKKVSDLKERVRICSDTEGAILISIHQNTFSESRYSGAQVFYGQAEGSEQLARTLQEAFVHHVNPGSSRRAKKADGIYLMEHAECTGVLIECGFLSNPEEEAKLRSPEYQKQLCCIIAATAANFAYANS